MNKIILVLILVLLVSSCGKERVSAKQGQTLQNLASKEITERKKNNNSHLLLIARLQLDELEIQLENKRKLAQYKIAAEKKQLESQFQHEREIVQDKLEAGKKSLERKLTNKRQIFQDKIEGNARIERMKSTRLQNITDNIARLFVPFLIAVLLSLSLFTMYKGHKTYTTTKAANRENELKIRLNSEDNRFRDELRIKMNAQAEQNAQKNAMEYLKGLSSEYFKALSQQTQTKLIACAFLPSLSNKDDDEEDIINKIDDNKGDDDKGDAEADIVNRTEDDKSETA